MFAKTPQAGKVKTRLACDTSDDFAVTFYKACLHQLFNMLRQCKADIVLYLTPESDPEYFTSYQPDHIFIQKGDDLGERMKNALQEQLNVYQKVMLIGSDIPTMSDITIAQAQIILDDHEAVLGPAADGGYYLIGFQKDHFTDCFHSIQWSTNTVLEKTLALLSHKKVKLLSICADVDTLEDLQALYKKGLLPSYFNSLLMRYPKWFSH